MTLRGRDDTAARLTTWAATPGLITVWGPPGVGKTALVQATLPDFTVVDARGLTELPLHDKVVWDGADPDVARAHVPRAEGTVIVTARARLDLAEERALEVGPLDEDDALHVLRTAMERAGHDLGEEALQAIARPLDGLPLALVRAARWLDVVGVEGLCVGDPSGWRGPRDVPPHLDSVTTALDDAWGALDPTDRIALSTLALAIGPITLPLAKAVLHEDALGALRRLRDGSWLVSPGPGALRMLRPLRAYLLRTAPPPPYAVDAFAHWLLDRAEEGWTGLEQRGASDLGPMLDDLIAAIDHRPADARVVPALSLLCALRPSTALTERVEAALRLHPRSVDLHRARARLHRSAGDLGAATEVLETALPWAEGRLRGVVTRELGVLAHRGRHIDAAKAHYEAALALHAESSDTRSEALTQANLAALAHDEARFDEAMKRYQTALDLLRSQGDRRLEGIMRSNLAVLESETGRGDRAYDELTRAVALLADGDDARLEAIARGNLGWQCFLSGFLGEAESHLRTSLDSLEVHHDVRTQATCLGRLAAVLAADRTDEAVLLFERADRILAGTEDRLARRLVALLRSFVDLAKGQRGDAVVRLTSARKATDDEAALIAISDDARSIVRALESRLVASPGPALCIGDEGAWIRPPNGEPASLERYANARRMLLALAEARLDRPGKGLELGELFTAGWPDERIRESSARNRVHVTLNKLRAVGLKPFILRGDSGYLLDPDLPLLVVGEPMPQASSE